MVELQFLNCLAPSNGIHAVASRILGKLCVQMEALPKGFHLIEADIRKTSDDPIGIGGNAAVYLGSYHEMAVALKCFQILDKSMARKIYKVRAMINVPVCLSLRLTPHRHSAERLSIGSVSNTRISLHFLGLLPP